MITIKYTIHNLITDNLSNVTINIIADNSLNKAMVCDDAAVVNQGCRMIQSIYGDDIVFMDITMLEDI